MASDATGADDGLQQDSSSGSSRLTRARSARTTCSALSTRTPGALHPPPSQTSIGLAIPNDVPDYHGEPAGPPALAPDCSACGQRLEFMRYVCTICGESHMWLEGEEGKEATLQALRTGEGSSGSSISTRAEWTPINGANSECSELLPSRSIDTTADDLRTAQELHAVTAGSVISMDTPTPPASPRAYHNQIADDEFPLVAGPPKSNKRHGYELCPNCIDVQGIAHSKAMIKEDMEPSAGEVPRSAIRRLNDVRHTYQELMWGAKGWTEIGEQICCRPPEMLTADFWNGDCFFQNTTMIAIVPYATSSSSRTASDVFHVTNSTSVDHVIKTLKRSTLPIAS